ncbi:MAG: GyrI-like domain-containing protein [bacterium]
MNPRIEQLPQKTLVGLQMTMSLVQNKTGQLWGQFGPRIKEIPHRVSEDKISLQVYPSYYYQNFNPTNEFDKWAAVEVNTITELPEGLDTFILEEGLYAVFNYKGSSADTSIYQYIFNQWIPNSKYVVDDRPHFEVLGEKYRNNDPNSEEEIWIPIKE